MAIKKFYSNKQKAGWKLNPAYKPKKKGQSQKQENRKYYSWGFDIDLEPVEFDENGKPKRNRLRKSGFLTKGMAELAVGRIRLLEFKKEYDI